MRYFLDLEFLERGTNGHGEIDFISIGLVSQDNREYYAENATFDWSRAALFNPWLLDNVKPHLYGHKHSDTWKHPTTIRDDILEFITPVALDGTKDPEHGRPEFWGEWCAYDWVAFCWLFGPMNDLPEGFPMFCRDLQQVNNLLGGSDIPVGSDTEHHALADAFATKARYEWLKERATAVLKYGLTASAVFV
jgi:hypothetical protein